MPVPELDYKPILVPSLLSQRARDEPSLTFREDYRPDTQQWHATTYAEFEQHVDSFVHAFLDAGLPLRTRQSSPDDAIASVPVVATLAGSSVADTAAYFAIIKMGCAVSTLRVLFPRPTQSLTSALLLLQGLPVVTSCSTRSDCGAAAKAQGRDPPSLCAALRCTRDKSVRSASKLPRCYQGLARGQSHASAKGCAGIEVEG